MSEGLYPPFALDFRTHVAQLFSIHPRNPQVRLLRQAAHILDEGGIGAIDFYTEWKSVYVDYSDRLQKAQIDRPE